MEWYFLVLIFFTHWVGDFLLQSDEIATTKSTSIISLLDHVMIYTLTLMVILSFFFKFEHVFFYSVLNGFFHFFIDNITSKINSYFYIRDERHWFFTSIGFDQFLHLSILVSLTYML